MRCWLRLEHEREEIVTYGRRLLQSGLTVGTGGNLSLCCRASGLLAISPSAMDYGAMEPRDVVVTTLEGKKVSGRRKASNELPLHLAVYAVRTDIAAVVHAHPPWSTTLACLGLEIPPLHYLVGLAGYKVPLAPYAMPGSRQLARETAHCMGECNAALMANHGLIAVGASLGGAFRIAEAVEFTARLYCQARALGEPVLLPQKEMKRLISKLDAYTKGR